MKGKIDIQHGVCGDEMQSSHQNATLSVIGRLAVNIAVRPQFPDGFDVDDADAVEAFLREKLAPIVDAGFEVDIQIGPDQEEDEVSSDEHRS